MAWFPNAKYASSNIIRSLLPSNLNKIESSFGVMPSIILCYYRAGQDASSSFKSCRLGVDVRRGNPPIAFNTILLMGVSLTPNNMFRTKYTQINMCANLMGFPSMEGIKESKMRSGSCHGDIYQSTLNNKIL